ncbi:MAG: DMT family transporter [Coriobacteriales bacterium]|jgi:drug/metabolite transporter (DMT)-like permease|nr:DMT family transporter [Coriobacteriales bacterium]
MSKNGGEHKTRKRKVLILLALHLIVLLYSLAGVCSKTAAQNPFGSLPFFGWYALALAILVVYALVWQQIIRRVELTSAFANKAATLVWGMLWGALFFAEPIKLTTLIGAVVVFIGILLVITSKDTAQQIEQTEEQAHE